MGWKTFFNARGLQVGNARAKAVLLELAHCFNETTGQCNPSVEHLARVTELQPKTVSAATAFLAEHGFITKSIRKTPHGRQCFYGLTEKVTAAASADRKVETARTDQVEIGGTVEFGGTAETDLTGKGEIDCTHTVETACTHTVETASRKGIDEKEYEKEYEKEEGTSSKEEVPMPSPEDVAAMMPHGQAALFDAVPEAGQPQTAETVVIGQCHGKALRPSFGHEDNCGAGTKTKPAKRKRDGAPPVQFKNAGIGSLPADWRTICGEIDSELDPEAAFKDFADYWLTKTKRRSDWTATWRNNIRSLQSADLAWKRSGLLKKSVRASVAPRGKSRELLQSERDYDEEF